MEIQRLNALLNTQSPAGIGEAKAQQATAPQNGPSFGDILSQAINSLEQSQIAADKAAQALAAGETTDFADVMIKSEKASLNLGLAVQVRNKLLEAYQEIMRMPL